MTDRLTVRQMLSIRAKMLQHPRQARRQLIKIANGGAGWYSDALPLRLFQHLAPHPFTRLTFCGRIAGERSTGEIRTRLGWDCRKCRRRSRLAVKAGGSDD